MGMILKKITEYIYEVSPKEFVKKLGLEGMPTFVSYSDNHTGNITIHTTVK